MHFSHASKDFLVRPIIPEANKLQVLERKSLVLLLDLTNSGDVFDDSFTIQVQERGELSDYLKFNSRPISLELGKHHVLEIQVSRFVETDRYSNLESHQKECTSRITPGAKR